jgi:coenzyme F420-reducing hydrogenase delta subunit
MIDFARDFFKQLTVKQMANVVVILLISAYYIVQVRDDYLRDRRMVKRAIHNDSIMVKELRLLRCEVKEGNAELKESIKRVNEKTDSMSTEQLRYIQRQHHIINALANEQNQLRDKVARNDSTFFFWRNYYLKKKEIGLLKLS